MDGYVWAMKIFFSLKKYDESAIFFMIVSLRKSWIYRVYLL